METLRRRRKDREPRNGVADMSVAAFNLVARNSRPSRTALTAPTHEDIACRAYELYERRGGAHGRDWEDWFQAERDLKRPVD